MKIFPVSSLHNLHFARKIQRKAANNKTHSFHVCILYCIIYTINLGNVCWSVCLCVCLSGYWFEGSRSVATTKNIDATDPTGFVDKGQCRVGKHASKTAFFKFVDGLSSGEKPPSGLVNYKFSDAISKIPLYCLFSKFVQ